MARLELAGNQAWTRAIFADLALLVESLIQGLSNITDSRFNNLNHDHHPLSADGRPHLRAHCVYINSKMPDVQVSIVTASLPLSPALVSRPLLAWRRIGPPAAPWSPPGGTPSPTQYIYTYYRQAPRRWQRGSEWLTDSTQRTRHMHAGMQAAGWVVRYPLAVVCPLVLQPLVELLLALSGAPRLVEPPRLHHGRGEMSLSYRCWLVV